MKTIRNIARNFIYLAIITVIFSAFWGGFEYLVGKVMPASWIWHYNQLEPIKEEYEVGEPLTIYSERWLLTGGKIIWEDYLYCASDEPYGKRYKITDTAHLEGGHTESTWVYGDFEGSHVYLFQEPGTGCYLQSTQTFMYNGVEKTQTFISGPFSIRERN